MFANSMRRVTGTLFALCGLLIIILAWTPATARAEPLSQELNNPRYFAETGFWISNDTFWRYFQRRGGVGTFGYPVSREFELLGSRVQIFQRLVMQIGPEGNAQTLNLLDEGLMPYTHINGSTYPAPDPGITQQAPFPPDPDYAQRIVAFVQQQAPETWNDVNVRFWATFSSAVSYEQAFPEADQPEALLPLVNLEVWGAPTSEPAYDPNNQGFVYQRFQRGIAHYREACDCTEGVLLGDYFKAILTGENLPPDLAAQASENSFYLQHDPAAPHGLARPDLLPHSDLANAFVREGPTLVREGEADPSAASDPALAEVTPPADPAAGSPAAPVAPPTETPAAMPQPAATTVPYRAQSPEYGLSIFAWGHPQTTARDLGRLSEIRFGWQKTLFQWQDIEGACKGCFDWSEADRIVQASNAAGIKILARLDFQPRWARADGAHNGPPDNYQDFADFVHALVSRYKAGSPHGRLHAIQVWNEPNLSREWGNMPINRQSAGDYVRLLKLAYQAAKSADPEVTVVTAGMSPTGWNDHTARPDDVYLQWLYDAGMKGHYDVLGAHGNTQAPAPEMEIGSWIGCGGGACTHGSFYFRRLEQLRNIMVRNGDGDKQIWVLEFGWTSDQINPSYAWFAVSEEQKGDNIVRAFQYARQHWGPWIGVMFLWTMPDPHWSLAREEVWWAITNPDGSPRPAYHVLLEARRSGALP